MYLFLQNFTEINRELIHLISCIFFFPFHLVTINLHQNLLQINVGNRNSDAEYTCKHNPLIKQFILNMSNIHPTYAMYYEILWSCLISVKRRIINNFLSMTI